MIKQLLLATSLLSLASILNANGDAKLGVPSVVITNDTSYNLKVGLQFKDQLEPKNQEPQLEKMDYIMVSENANGEDVAKFSKPGSLTGYKGAKFSVSIVIQRMGVRAEEWTGEFTGKDVEFSHDFQYKPVVQHPTTVMSVVNLKMSVNYKNGNLNITFTAPTEELDD